MVNNNTPHIAVNTRLLLGNRLEGIGRFAYEVLKRMVENNPEVRFSFLFDRKYDPKFLFGKNVTAYVVPPPARHPVLWHTWFHLTMRRKLDKLNPDVFFSPEFYLTSSKKVPQVPVFHDIAYEHFPKDIAPFASWHCRTFSPRYARRATRLLTVSEFSKQDLIHQYGLPPEKISVVYNGASEHFRPVPEEEKQEVRTKYAEGQPYFHFVGAIQPRKNIETLLLGFDTFKTLTDSPAKLLLVGRKGWKYDGAMQAFENMKHKNEVLFTGYIPDDQLNGIYAASQGLCYVPYFEGFGIPVLEAMYSETPVICSNSTSLPEVAGEAALLVDPMDPTAIANAMLRLWQEPGLREGLIAKGRDQRTRFSWDATYEKVWEVLKGFLY